MVKGSASRIEGCTQKPSKFLRHQMRDNGSPTLLEDFMRAGREMAFKESNVSRGCPQVGDVPLVTAETGTLKQPKSKTAIPLEGNFQNVRLMRFP